MLDALHILRGESHWSVRLLTNVKYADLGGWPSIKHNLSSIVTHDISAHLNDSQSVRAHENASQEVSEDGVSAYRRGRPMAGDLTGC